MAQPKIGSVCHKHVTLLYYMKESSNRNRFSRPQICHPIPQSCHPTATNMSPYPPIVSPYLFGAVLLQAVQSP